MPFTHVFKLAALTVGKYALSIIILANNYSMAAWRTGQGAISHMGDSKREGSNPVEAICLKLFHFLSFFPFSLFAFFLTADPLKLRKDFAITYF